MFGLVDTSVHQSHTGSHIGPALKNFAFSMFFLLYKKTIPSDIIIFLAESYKS